MNEQPHVFVIDDDADMGDTCRKILEKRGFLVSAFQDARKAIEQMEIAMPDAVLSDVRMPGMDGSQLLEELRKRESSVPVVLMTGFGTIQNAVAALRAGASDYIPKPFTRDELLNSLERVLEVRNLRGEVSRLRDALQKKEAAGTIIGGSKTMQKVFQRIEATSGNDATVLITGENGTGKDLVARAIHSASARSAKPFIAINCGALPRELIESELFGHKKGSFTGANQDNPGMFRSADGGTIFLDEIGEMPADMQVKLLRALQERKVRRVGDSSEFPVDVRVIAATNRDLESMMKAGEFRQDLFYRLSVVSIHVPALRERLDDLPVLLRHFIKKHSPNAAVEGFTREALRTLERYAWPGNVRELENTIEGVIALGARGHIDVQDLPERISEANPMPSATTSHGPQRLRTLEEEERRLIQEALIRCGGNKSKAAELLGISRTRLYRKLDEESPVPS